MPSIFYTYENPTSHDVKKSFKLWSRLEISAKYLEHKSQGLQCFLYVHSYSTRKSIKLLKFNIILLAFVQSFEKFKFVY